MDIYSYITMAGEVRDFIELGGSVLAVIGIVSFCMWFLIFERLIYLWFSYPRVRAEAVAAWQARAEKNSWHAHRVREMLISAASQKLESRVSLIKSCVAICPLLGLLGTASGMVLVFETMAISGGGNSRSMASGVAMATIPTMAGMVAALSGLVLADWLQARVGNERRLLGDSMVHDQGKVT